MGYSLHWFICQLHSNELPLRHLFKFLDGDTSGPRAFSGAIGKLLIDCEKLPLHTFSAIHSANIPSKLSDISSDQAYLLEICRAVSTGVCNTELVHRSPGKMAHSRWVTTANRILRLYISTVNPSKQLLILATFVVQVYGPMWFEIKRNSLVTNAPSNLFKAITLSRYLPEYLKKIIDPVMARNAYFAHPENILLEMLNDERPHIRQLAVCRILKARSNSASNELRTFMVPKINFEANDYIELINWQETSVYEPPITKKLTSDELPKFYINFKNLSSYPCHTQAVERCVKMVTEAAGSVMGSESRDGQIRTKIRAREINPTFESKKDYNLNTK